MSIGQIRPVEKKNKQGCWTEELSLIREKQQETRTRTCSCHAQEDKLTGEAWASSENDDQVRERCQSRTWDIEDGGALVHGEHIGAGAHVDPSVFRPNVMDSQDAVEVHSAVGELSAALSCPHERVRWELCEVQAQHTLFSKLNKPQMCSMGF